MKFSCAVLIVRDTSLNKTTTDKCGPILAEEIKKSFPEVMGPLSCTIVPDIPDEIFASLERLSEHNINIILTMGGTILQAADMAMVSRAVVGVKNNSLMINLPGNLKDALNCFDFIKTIIPNTIDLTLNRKASIKNTLTNDQQVSAEENVARTENNIGHENHPSSYFKLITAPLRYRTYSFHKKSFDDAFQIVCDSSKYTLDVEEIAIEDSLNRVLARDDNISGEFKIPLQISTTQGYAMKSGDGKGERILKTSCTPYYNQSDFTLQSGEAVRVSVGSCLPKGANAVVPTEDVSIVRNGTNEIKIMIKKAPACNQHLKLKESVKFYARRNITSAYIGIFAALGIFKVKVNKSARVGILATGDALYSQRTTNFSPGCSKNCNNLMLLNLLKTFGYTANDLGNVKLHPDLLKQALHKAFIQHDVVITTGGVSIGEYEMIKEVLEIDFEATIHFGRVNMEPGYLTTFATCSFNGCSKFVFSLPGDYASAMISCRLLVIPALRTYEFSSNNTYNPYRVCYTGSSKHNIQGNDELQRFRRVTLIPNNDRCTKFIFNIMNDDFCSDFYECFTFTTFSAILICPKSLQYNAILKAIMLFS